MVSKNRMKILEILKEHDELNITQLAEKTGIDITNMAKFYKPLVNEGKINKRIVQDGRSKLIYLSLNNGIVMNNDETIISKVETKKIEPKKIESGKVEKIRPVKVEKIELETIEIEEKPELEEIGDGNVISMKLGIGFFKDLARTMGIKKYSHMTLKQLKKACGKILLEGNK